MFCTKISIAALHKIKRKSKATQIQNMGNFKIKYDVFISGISYWSHKINIKELLKIWKCVCYIK